MNAIHIQDKGQPPEPKGPNPALSAPVNYDFLRSLLQDTEKYYLGELMK